MPPPSPMSWYDLEVFRRFPNGLRRVRREDSVQFEAPDEDSAKSEAHHRTRGLPASDYAVLKGHGGTLLWVGTGED